MSFQIAYTRKMKRNTKHNLRRLLQIETKKKKSLRNYEKQKVLHFRSAYFLTTINKKEAGVCRIFKNFKHTENKRC